MDRRAARDGQLDERLWFVILLALGVWNMGLIAMILHVIAGPDGEAEVRSRQAVATATGGPAR